MTDFDPEADLGQLVNDRPRLAGVFDSFGLDYCCGGRRSLRLACADAGLDPAEVMVAAAALDDGPPVEWVSMGPAELTEHLEATHHEYLRRELPRLAVLGDKVVGVHGHNHPELRAVMATFTELRADLEPHLMKEERVLFPMIRELAAAETRPSFHCGSVANPITAMGMEHDRAGELLARLREQTDQFRPPADGCESYRALYAGLGELEADLHLHVHKENNLLFPAAVEMEAKLSSA